MAHRCRIGEETITSGYLKPIEINSSRETSLHSRIRIYIQPFG